MPRNVTARGKSSQTEQRQLAISPSFYTDVTPVDTQYAVLVRSRVKRGIIRSISAPEMPVGYRFFTAQDIPGKNALKTFNTDIPIFAFKEIQYEGEPVGIVAGPDRAEARRLASLVEIDVEELPPFEFSSTFGAEQILAKRVVLSGSSDSILANTPETVENTYTTVPNYQNFSETNGAIAVYSDEGTLEVYSSTRWPYHLRTAVSGVLGIHEGDIVIHQTLPGETVSGNLWFPSLTAAQTAVAAWLMKKPVKLEFTRFEDFSFTEKEARIEIRYHTALDPMSAILAMNVRILIDGGAYSPLIEEIVDRMVIAAAGAYSLPAYRIEAYAIRTSAPPMGTGFDWGESQSFYGMENHIDEIARHFNFIPYDLKRKNLFGHGRPMITGAEPKNSEDIVRVLDTVMENSDYLRKYTAYSFLGKKRQGVNDGPLRGIGLAAAFQGSGFLGSSQSRGTYQLETVMETDGSLTIKMNSYSASMRQIWQKVAAGLLGISPDLVHFDTEFAADEGTLGPETLSSNITIMTQLLKKCCSTIQKQRFRQPLPIVVKRSFSTSRKSLWDPETFTGMPYNSLSWGAAVVEVEIDVLTYEVNITGSWLAVDGGEIFIEKAALATLQKTAAQALSRTIGDCAYVKAGAGGARVTSNYDGLYLLRNTHPAITLMKSEDDARGIGDIAYSLIPGAYTAALSQALGQTVTDIPVRGDTLYAILKKGGPQR